MYIGAVTGSLYVNQTTIPARIGYRKATDTVRAARSRTSGKVSARTCVFANGDCQAL